MNNFQQNENPFNFDEYISKESALNNSPQNTSNNNQENLKPFNFDEYTEKPLPNMLEEFGRHTARVGSRIAETVAGFPGDLVGFAKFIEQKLPKLPESFQKEPNFLCVQKYGRRALEKLPSSQELKEFSSYLTSGFTDPQSAREELGDDITSLATSLLIPSKDPLKFKSIIKSRWSCKYF